VNISRYVRRAGAVLALVASGSRAQTPTLMRVGESFWVRFYASGDTSETRVARGTAKWLKCGPKWGWAFMYTGPDSVHLIPLDSLVHAFTVPCAVPMPVATVAMTLALSTLAPGDTTTASATLKDSTGALLTRPIAWSSSNQAVATVSTVGLVTAISQGTSTILATSETKSASAILTVTAPRPPPDTTPASIVASPSTITLIAGRPQTLTATITTASGATLPLSPTSWTSSDSTKATVSAGGVVTWAALGTANIVAHYNALASSAVVVTALPPPPPSSAHPNEPAGFVSLSPTLTGDVQPPTAQQYVAGSANEIGWINSNGSVTKVTDASSPTGSTNALEVDFPAGFIGGISPGGVYTMSSTNPQNWPQQPRSLYQSYWYKVSPNFPANLNANKMVYSNIGGGNKVYTNFGGGVDYRLVNGVVEFAPGQATAYTTPLFMSVDIQGVVQVDGAFQPSFNLRQNVGPSDPTQWKQLVRGQWHHIETLYIANTAGARDGTVKLWVDGTLVIDFTNRIQWSATVDAWQWTTWLPVYGGGGMVPTDAVNAYHRLKDFYVSGPAPTARRTPTKQP
jgi:hypothetical protein